MIKKILAQVADLFYPYSNTYKAMEERCNSLEEINANLNQTLEKAEQTLAESEAKYELAKKELQKLLYKEIVSIQDYRELYEGKKSKASWMYDFNSDGQAQDVSTVLQDTEAQQIILRSAAKELIKKYGLMSTDEPEFVIECVVAYFKAKTAWEYKYDTQNDSQFKRKDFWQSAAISWETRSGDCEDLAILIHNLLYYMFEFLEMQEHYWRLEFTAWALVSNLGGHAFNIWLGEDGEYYVIESTFDLVNSFKKTWLKTPIRFNNLYQYPFGWARKDRSWSGAMSALDNIIKNVTEVDSDVD